MKVWLELWENTELNQTDFDNCAFTHAHYKSCLEFALEDGYTFRRMKDASSDDQSGKTILMRHDEDMSLPAMCALAQIEGELGIQSTLFIRLHANNYNLLAIESYTSLTELLEMGHEIGFHYELHCHPGLSSREEEIFQKSKSLLESILDTSITGMSYHEPTRFLDKDEKRALPSGIEYEAYDNRFMENYKYISDSSAHWREGCMCQHIGKEENLYILTHGFWWYNKSPVENY